MSRNVVLWLMFGQQNESKLQPGAFYLDRSPQSKHLTWGGTAYGADKAEQLYKKLLEVGKAAQASSAT